MIRDTQFLLDDLSNARLGPHLATKSKGWCSLKQQLEQMTFLLRREARCGSVWFAPKQGQRALGLASAFHPLTDGSWGDAQCLSNRFLAPARLFEFQGAQSTSFPKVTGLARVGWFHACSIAHFRNLRSDQ